MYSQVYLRDGDSTRFGKFLFGFFTGVGVGQVGVEILVQTLCGLFAEVAPLAPDETQTGILFNRSTFIYTRENFEGNPHLL